MHLISQMFRLIRTSINYLHFLTFSISIKKRTMKTDPDMRVKQLEIKNMERGKCTIIMVGYTMGNGKMIRYKVMGCYMMRMVRLFMRDSERMKSSMEMESCITMIQNLIMGLPMRILIRCMTVGRNMKESSQIMSKTEKEHSIY